MRPSRVHAPGAIMKLALLLPLVLAAFVGAATFSVIASHRVRAERGPMTGSAKQSSPSGEADWIASSQGLLAITVDRGASAKRHILPSHLTYP